MNSTVAPVSLRDLAFVLFKRRWGILTTVVVTLLCGVTWLFLVRDDAYFVGAKVLVKLGREQAPPPSLVGMPPLSVGYRQQEVKSEIDILQSEDLITQVVDELGLDKRGPEPAKPQAFVARIRYHVKRSTKAVKEQIEELMIKAGLRERLSDRDVAVHLLKKGLTVVAQDDSNVIVVTLVLPFRQGSSVVLNTLVDRYKDYRAKIFSDPRAQTFFDEQTRRREAQLRSSEESLHALERSSEIRALEKQKEILLQQLAKAQEEARLARMAADDATTKLRRMEEEREKPEPSFATIGAVERDSFAAGLLTQLAELQREREKLRMTDLDSGIRIANNRQQFQTMLNLLLSNLRSMVREREERYSVWSAAIASLERRLDGLHASEAAWSDLKRKIKVDEDGYLFYKRKFEEVSADAALTEKDVTNVAVIEKATDPIGPAGMRKSTLLLILQAAGLLAALVWTAIAEFFDNRIYSASLLQRVLGVPVFAVFGYCAQAQAEPRWTEALPPMAAKQEARAAGV